MKRAFGQKCARPNDVIEEQAMQACVRFGSHSLLRVSKTRGVSLEDTLLDMHHIFRGRQQPAEVDHTIESCQSFI
jgi:hypothetical protein